MYSKKAISLFIYLYFLYYYNQKKISKKMLKGSEQQDLNF